VVGATVWLAGFFLEVIAGYQSLAFQERAPSGGRKGLDYWLWHLYHHPRNYGEIFLWLGYSAFALSVPSGIWTIYAPVVISLLLLIETSGVPLLEAEGLIPSSVA
jgi:steroid 5-alpha reductase family enzyme